MTVAEVITAMAGVVEDQSIIRTGLQLRIVIGNARRRDSLSGQNVDKEPVAEVLLLEGDGE